MFKSYKYKIVLSFLLILIPITIGTIGYLIVEDLTFIEAVYMSVITIATVGYGEVKPLTDAGRVFTIFLILTNLGLFAYAVGLISNIFIQNDFIEHYKKNRMKQRISKLKNHVIICGYGRNGREAAATFQHKNISYVIIEMNKEVSETLLNNGQILYLNEDATIDDVLIDAGINNARGLITTLPDDAANVYVTLTAREINKDITIVSRASSDNAVKKLKRAGANNVIMPDKIGGNHMATLMIQPDVKEFIDMITGQDYDVYMEEFLLNDIQQKISGNTIQELDLRTKTGVNIIGIKNADGDYIINPEVFQVLQHDCKLILMGTTKQMNALKTLKQG
jgi:voltage-gated potassium channel